MRPAAYTDTIADPKLLETLFAPVNRSVATTAFRTVAFVKALKGVAGPSAGAAGAIPVGRWPAGLRRLRFHAVDQQATVAGAYFYRFAVGDAAFQDHLGQRILQGVLNYPFQGPCAVDRVVARVS